MKPEMRKPTGSRIRCWFTDVVRRYGRDRRKVWILLCGLQGLLGVSVVHTTQDNASVTLLALIVWWGACLSMEAALPGLTGKPGPWAALAGVLLLMLCSWRAYATYHLDVMVYALFSLQAVGLALVGWPIQRYWKQAFQPIMILSLFGLQLLIQRALPMAPMTRATAKAVELFMALFDYQVVAQGNIIQHGTGSVVVVNGCSGLELAIQLTVTAMIFALVFPLQNQWRRLFAVALAPIIALAVNCVRVAVLTWIHASDLPGRDGLFDLIHEQWGGLLFAGVAVCLFGWLYLHWIEEQIRASAS